jgi:tetratricopeptide (TPR) repeat protein
MRFLRQSRDAPVRRRSARMVAALLLLLLPWPWFGSLAWGQEAASQTKHLLDDGLALARQGQLAEAGSMLQQAQSLEPGNTQVLTALAQVKGRTGDLPGAVQLLREVAHSLPNSPDAHVNLAVALADDGELQEALAETGKALTLAPQLASAHLNRARLLADLHRGPEAGAEFAAAARLAPTNPDCFYYWALVERDGGDFAKESLLLRKVVKLQPENSKAYELLGDSLAAQSKQTEAIAAWRAALAIDPNSTAALYSLWRSLQRTNPAEAKRLRDQFAAVQQAQKKIDAVKSLGNQAYVAMGEHKDAEAIQLFRQAIEQCGGCEVAAALHKDLGLALCRVGDVASGKKELQTALQLNPKDPDVVKALGLLN